MMEKMEWDGIVGKAKNRYEDCVFDENYLDERHKMTYYSYLGSPTSMLAFVLLTTSLWPTWWQKIIIGLTW